MSKHELRKKMRAIFPLPPHLRAGKSRCICDVIAALPQWEGAGVVAIFAPQEREPDVELLWECASGRKFGYPRIDGEELELFSVLSPSELRPAQWGIREPVGLPENLIAPREVDIVLVPGVAFTRGGLRCGRGGGFYDRLLAALPEGVLKIGVCFSEQLVDDLPTEPHDRAVDLVISA